MKGNAKALAAAALVLAATAATAEDVPIPRDTVDERLQESLRAQGIRAGALIIYPTVGLAVSADDNIFAEADDEVSDTVTVVEPAIDVRSDWSRHSLQFGASASIGRYADSGDEDYDDGDAYARVRLQMSSTSALSLGARLSALHEDRSSPDDRGGLSPTEFDRTLLDAAYAREAGRVRLRLDASFAEYDYDDTRSLTGSINHDDRDREEVGADVRFGIAVSDAATVFVRGGRTDIGYDQAVDDAGFRRDADETRLALGVELDITGRTSIEAFGGRMERGFDDASLEDIDATWFGARVVHRISGLTTFTLNADRDVRASSLANASGYVTTRVGGGIDHELLRNLVLKLRVYRQDNEYEGIERDEELLDAEFEAFYLVNRHVDLRLRARLRERDVEQTIADNDNFDANVISLVVNGKL